MLWGCVSSESSYSVTLIPLFYTFLNISQKENIFMSGKVWIMSIFKLFKENKQEFKSGFLLISIAICKLTSTHQHKNFILILISTFVNLKKKWVFKNQLRLFCIAFILTWHFTRHWMVILLLFLFMFEVKLLFLHLKPFISKLSIPSSLLLVEMMDCT